MKPRKPILFARGEVFPLIASLLFIFNSLLSGQSGIKGVVLDNEGNGVSFANILVVSPTDSALIRGNVANDNGHFEMNNIVPGTYILRINMIGFSEHFSERFSINEGTETRDFGTITLYEDAVLMNAVEVVAKKPLFEQRIDRMVVNVANSITSSGTNALEVLERSPGVMVNRQSNTLSLSGKNGVVVMINGRINYMPADAVVRMLEGMSSDNIERIEIITTPPAGFDAEGNAGYINIVLKKSIEEGFNGSAGGSIGFNKGIQASANTNFNYRKGKANLYGDYSYLKESQDQVFAFYRRILLNGDQLETDTRSLRDPDTDNHNVRLGVDFQLSEKTVLGVLASGYDTKWTMDAINTSLISRNGNLDTSIIIRNHELNQWKHAGGNINLQHTFKEGRVLTIDTDMLWYKDTNPTDYDNEYSDGEGNFLFEELTRSRKITPIDIKVGKIDYTTPLGKNLKIETGVKGSLSHFTNDVGVDHLEGQTWIADPELTANYDLVEKILAAHLSFEMPIFSGFQFKAGVRYEYTSSNLGALEQPDIVDRHFGEFFPSLFLSKDFNENNSVNASYSRRITRPTFNDMAPFVLFLDPTTFFSGNPALQPAISNNFRLGYRFKTMVATLEYGIEDSTIARFQSTVVPGTNRELIFAENLIGTNTISLALSIPVTPVKWWNMFYNIMGSYQTTSKYFGSEIFEFKAGGVNVFGTQTFTLPKNFTFEISGFYSTGGLFGIVLMDPMGSVNVGLQKKFGENGGTLRIGYDDVFNTLAFTGESDLPEQGQYFKAYLVFQVPTFKIGYSYNFGNQKMKAKRERATGAEEERRRIQ